MDSSDSRSEFEVVSELDELEPLNELKVKKAEDGEESEVYVAKPSKMEMQEDKESTAAGESEKPTSFFTSVRRFMGFERAQDPLDDEKDGKDALNVVEKETGLVEKEVDEVPVEVEVEGLPEEKDMTTIVREHDFDVSGIAEGIEKPVVKPVENGRLAEEPFFEPDLVFVEVQRGLLQSISMKLWLANMFQEGGVEEKQFIKMFKDYEVQVSSYLDHREELLSYSRKVDSLESALKETRVYLEELKMKKTIGTVSDEEYRVKARALDWDINHYEQELSRKNAESDFLEDLTRVLSDEEVSNLQAMAEKCRYAMDNLKDSDRVSSETSTMVRDSLRRTLEFLDTFWNYSVQGSVEPIPGLTSYPTFP